jgi:uncharacterized Zn finger protein
MEDFMSDDVRETCQHDGADLLELIGDKASDFYLRCPTCGCVYDIAGIVSAAGVRCPYAPLLIQQ